MEKSDIVVIRLSDEENVLDKEKAFGKTANSSSGGGTNNCRESNLRKNVFGVRRLVLLLSSSLVILAFGSGTLKKDLWYDAVGHSAAGSSSSKLFLSLIRSRTIDVLFKDGGVEQQTYFVSEPIVGVHQDEKFSKDSSVSHRSSTKGLKSSSWEEAWDDKDDNHNTIDSNVDSNSALKIQKRFLQQISDTADTTCTKECCSSQYACPVCPQAASDTTTSTSSSPLNAIPFVIQILLIMLLLLVSALFSGLTLGFMGLDITGLEIIIASDDKVQSEYAKSILPIRKNGNLLLCTLVLGNVAVNALTSIFMADISGGTIGFILSTFLIVIFGEILPQAACSRYALYVGSHSIPIVRVFLVLLYPIAKPLAFGLDYMLGRELVTIYSEAEMLKLLQIHVKENAIDYERASIMTGALKYKNRFVKDVMTHIDNTFMLNVDDKLNFHIISKVFKSGYSRIPVYEISRNNIVGLLFVKDLILIDPEDNTRVADFVEIFGRHLHIVWQDDKLSDVLPVLKKGKSHMALVRDVVTPVTPDVVNDDSLLPSIDPYYELLGIITLEDIIEEILGDEIVDETDEYLDGSHSKIVDRSRYNGTFDWGRLRLLDSKIIDDKLSYDEAKAVVAHLQKNHSSVVSLITEKQLSKLVLEESYVIQLHPSTEHDDGIPKELLYNKGEEIDFCTLILSGKITIIVGEENFHTDVSSWCLLGAGAIEKSNYKPDFTAYVSGDGDCRCLRIMRSKFIKAIDASAVERMEEKIGSIHSGVVAVPVVVDTATSESESSVDKNLSENNTMDVTASMDESVDEKI